MGALKAPMTVAAIIIAVVGAFAVGGPRLALPLGFLAAAAVVIIAVKQKPYEAIRPPKPSDTASHILVAIDRPVEDDAAARRLTKAIDELIASEPDWPDRSEVVVLAPAKTSFLDRWATDVRSAREDAQRSLVITIASLAKLNIDATARVGDADLTQATEDYLRTYPATAVVLVTGAPATDDEAEQAFGALERRLTVPLRRVEIPG